MHHAHQSPGNEDSCRPSQEGNEQRLKDKLGEDVAPACPQRQLDADLMRPLLDHHVHHIRYAHARDQQRQAPDRAQENLYPERDLSRDPLPFDEIPDTQGPLVGRVEVILAGEDPVDLSLELLLA